MSYDRCTFYRADDIDAKVVLYIIVIVSYLHVQPWCATKLEDDFTEKGNVASWGFCGPDCPIETNAWKTDDTLKVTHHYLDQKEKMTAVKLYGVMASSLLLIALMVKLLGIISGSEI